MMRQKKDEHWKQLQRCCLVSVRRGDERMLKVKKEHYEKFIAMAKANTCNTVYPMSVAEGIQQGDIYTDCMKHPTFALFWHVSGFAYLTGKPDEENLNEIYNLMTNKSGTNPRRFVLELKDEEVAGYFQKKEDIKEHPRYRFRLEELLGNDDAQCRQEAEKLCEATLPEGYELKEVDEKLLPRISGRIVPSSFWSSGEEFLKNGKGYCIVYDGEVAAVAFSAAVSSMQVDIGIETAEAHRRKGLAAIVAKKMVDYVKSIQKEPVWDCDAVNTGSRCTAEKVGFRVMAEHAYYKV